MVKPVTGLSIHMRIFKLNFIKTNIYSTIYDTTDKTHNPTNLITDNSVYIFLHITLVTSLSIADLTHNFSESTYIYPYYKSSKLYSDSTNNYPALGKVQFPISCLHDVSEKWCY